MSITYFHPCCPNCDEAAKNGHLQCLWFLHVNGHSFSSGACNLAAKGGHLPCLRYLHQNGCFWNAAVADDAAWYGHFDCLKYLQENGCSLNDQTSLDTVWNGHKKYLKYNMSILKFIVLFKIYAIRFRKRYYTPGNKGFFNVMQRLQNNL